MTVVRELNFDGEVSEREINTDKYIVAKHNGGYRIKKNGRLLSIFEVCEILNQR